jgi:hypothetical protein
MEYCIYPSCNVYEFIKNKTNIERMTKNSLLDGQTQSSENCFMYIYEGKET